VAYLSDVVQDVEPSHIFDILRQKTGMGKSPFPSAFGLQKIYKFTFPPPDNARSPKAKRSMLIIQPLLYLYKA